MQDAQPLDRVLAAHVLRLSEASENRQFQIRMIHGLLREAEHWPKASASSETHDACSAIRDALENRHVELAAEAPPRSDRRSGHHLALLPIVEWRVALEPQQIGGAPDHLVRDKCRVDLVVLRRATASMQRASTGAAR